MRRLPETATIIFDGSCHFCTWSIELTRRVDRHRRLRTLPFQGQGVLRKHNLTQAEAEDAAWAITPSGKRYRGAGAINMALSVALGSRIPILLYELPLVRRAQDAIYELIARNRTRFRGVTPYCQQHPEACA